VREREKNRNENEGSSKISIDDPSLDGDEIEFGQNRNGRNGRKRFSEK